MQTLQRTALLAARALWKRQARRLAQAVLPETLVPLVPLLLLADCSGKVGVAVVEALLVQVAPVVQAVAAQVAVVAVVAAAHTRPALVA